MHFSLYPIFSIMAFSALIIIVIPASAETFALRDVSAETFVLKGSSDANKFDFLYIEFYNETPIKTGQVLVKHNERVIDLSGVDVKFYESGGFVIKSKEMSIYAHPISTLENLEYDLIVLFFGDKREKLNFHSASVKAPKIKDEVIAIDPIEEWRKSLELTGMPHIETLKKIEEEKLKLEKEAQRIEDEKNKPSRTTYVQSDDKEIKILVDAFKRIPYYDQWEVDLRIVDPKVNVHQSYWEDAGWIDDVEIVITVKDPYGDLLDTFTGNTTNRGTYSPEGGTTFSYTSFYPQVPYTFEVLATKYFDDDQTFVTAMNGDEFYVYAPNDGGGPCAPGETHTEEGLCIADE